MRLVIKILYSAFIGVINTTKTCSIFQLIMLIYLKKYNNLLFILVVKFISNFINKSSYPWKSW